MSQSVRPQLYGLLRANGALVFYGANIHGSGFFSPETSTPGHSKEVACQYAIVAFSIIRILSLSVYSSLSLSTDSRTASWEYLAEMDL